VIAAEHNRDRAGRGNFADLSEDLAVCVFNAAWHYRRIPRINGGEDSEWINADLK
jgi:hypothetical protein